MKTRGTLAVVSALLLLAGMAAALPVKDQVNIEINDTGYTPASIEVRVGDTVVWTNRSQKGHTVTSTEKIAQKDPEGNLEEQPLFDSGPLKGGGTFEHVFDKEGTYEYSCQMDKTMKGIVIVRKAE